MSPEQTLGDPVDARSDLFSLGIVLYEMLAGMRPFNGPTQLTLIRQIVHESPQALDSSVPGKLTDIVNRCLAKQPDDRYPDASALADDLRRVAATLTREPAADVNVPAAPTATTVPRRRAGMPAAFAVGALLLAVLAWLGAPTLTQWARQITTSPSGQPDENASPQELYRRSTELLHFYYREGNVDRAIRQLELALQKKSPFPQADARLSLAYWRRNALNPDGEWQKRARAHADRAVSGDPQLAVAHIAQGAAFSIAGDSDRAVAAYERAATLDPGNYEIMWRMADLSLSRGDSGGAEEWYKRSTSTAPGEWEPLGRYGSFLYRQGRYLEAVQAWQRTGQLAPDHARVYANLGAAYHQLNRVDDAAAAFQRALEIAPNSGTYTNLGTLLYFQGKYPESVTAFEQAVKLGANTYLYWGNLADAVRMTAPGSEKMHESYRRAIQLARERQSTSPDDAEVRASLALYLARDGQLREATQELERALALKGVAPGALFKGALVAELSSQRTRALGYLERALAAGYGLREVRQEPDLVTLRTDPAYHTLISRYEK
jgi:serine/threonine-protein kinase